MGARLSGSILLILSVLGVIAGIGYSKYKQIAAQMEAPPPPEPAQAVTLVVARSAQWRPSTTAIGTVLAPQSVQLRTETAGMIAKLNIQSGQLVDKDAVLLQIDSSVEAAQLQGAQAAHRIAESTYKRTRQAAQANALSQLELEQSEAQMAQANAEVQRLKAVIRKKTITAPFQARVGLFDLHVGQYVQEGTPITMLQGVAPFAHIDFAMPQSVADFIQPGDGVSVSAGESTWQAKIVAVDSQADKLSRSLKARARLDNPPVSMQPNDSVRVELHYGAEQDAIAIPASALRRSPERTFVFIQELDEQSNPRARSRTVHVAATAAGEVLLLDGLTAGQSVVADGSFKLHDGSLLATLPGGSEVVAHGD